MNNSKTVQDRGVGKIHKNIASRSGRGVCDSSGVDNFYASYDRDRPVTFCIGGAY